MKTTDIPKNWQLKKLGEVCQVLDHLRTPINSSERQKRNFGKKENELFPYYGATGQVGWIDGYLTNGEFVLVGEDGAPFLDIFKEKAYRIKGKAWVNNHAHILQNIEGTTINDFILHYLNAINYREYVNGTTRLKLTKSSLVDIPFPIPTIAIQQAIVAKIEELFSELDKGIESLKTAQQQLKVYRQALLKWAFEGKLTNENVKEGELPKGWKHVFLADVSQSCLGKMLDKNKNIGTLKPYLRNVNVRWNSFDLENLNEMPFEEIESERFGIRNGDLIICEGGEPGRAAIWKDQIQNMKIQKALHRVRFKEGIIAEYFLHYLNLISSTKSLDKLFTGTTIKHLTGQSLRKISFPMPPKTEQLIIVQEIESRLSVYNKIEETITTGLQQSEALRQSILKKAFEGNLI